MFYLLVNTRLGQNNRKKYLLRAWISNVADSSFLSTLRYCLLKTLSKKTFFKYSLDKSDLGSNNMVFGLMKDLQKKIHIICCEV